MHPNHFLRPVLIAAISLFPCTSTAAADPGVTADKIVFGQVYLTVIQPGGSFKSIAALSKPGG